MRSNTRHLQTYQVRFTELQSKFDHLVEEVNATGALPSVFFTNQLKTHG
jgi:hypothetical protein